MKSLLRAEWILCFAFMQGLAETPTLINGDFEEPQIGEPFISSVAVPGWTRTGVAGNGRLLRVGYGKAGDSVALAGHGQQFLIFGDGRNSGGDTTWSTTVTGLTTGATYAVGFMIASEHPASGAAVTVTVVSPPSTAASQTFAITPEQGKPWTNWKTEQMSFVATLPTASLSFSVTNVQHDAGLDNITIAPARAQTLRGGAKPSAAYKIGGGVTAPVAIYRPSPEYSEAARNAKIEGTVLLFVVVDEAGNPWDLKVIRPLGYGLDQKAIEAVQNWKFRPGMKDGRAVPVQATVEVNFRLYN